MLNAVSRFVKEIPRELMDDRPPLSGMERSLNGEGISAALRKPDLRPKAVAPQKRTAAENKPFIAGGGLGSLSAMGISKGLGAVTGGKPDYDAGDRVRHVKYGEGTVLELEPGPRDYKVTVDFDEVGQKIMYAAFAKLVKL